MRSGANTTNINLTELQEDGPNPVVGGDTASHDSESVQGGGMAKVLHYDENAHYIQVAKINNRNEISCQQVTNIPYQISYSTGPADTECRELRSPPDIQLFTTRAAETGLENRDIFKQEQNGNLFLIPIFKNNIDHKAISINSNVMETQDQGQYNLTGDKHNNHFNGEVVSVDKSLQMRHGDKKQKNEDIESPKSHNPVITKITVI